MCRALASNPRRRTPPRRRPSSGRTRQLLPGTADKRQEKPPSCPPRLSPFISSRPLHRGRQNDVANPALRLGAQLTPRQLLANTACGSAGRPLLPSRVRCCICRRGIPTTWRRDGKSVHRRFIKRPRASIGDTCGDDATCSCAWTKVTGIRIPNTSLNPLWANEFYRISVFAGDMRPTPRKKQTTNLLLKCQRCF